MPGDWNHQEWYSRQGNGQTRQEFALRARGTQKYRILSYLLHFFEINTVPTPGMRRLTATKAVAKARQALGEAHFRGCSQCQVLMMEKGQFCIRGVDAQSEERVGTQGRKLQYCRF
jgi:hypothetical protein